MEVYIIVTGILLLAFLAWYLFKRNKAGKGLPVLMYHKIIAHGKPDFLSVNRHMLERQFNFIKSGGYNTISLSELDHFIKTAEPVPPKTCVITFDDGYRDNYTEMFPILKKYGLKANIFLVPSFLEAGEKSGHEYLRMDEIKLMSADGSVEFGLHSVNHDSYNDLSLEKIRDDIQACRQYFDKQGIKYQEALAYTYGAFPKHDRLKRTAMFQLFEQLGIGMAFRIGNRINAVPVHEKYLVQRLDIRGDEAFRKFKKALKYGKKVL